MGRGDGEDKSTRPRHSKKGCVTQQAITFSCSVRLMASVGWRNRITKKFRDLRTLQIYPNEMRTLG